jgi:hypothetical protein
MYWFFLEPKNKETEVDILRKENAKQQYRIKILVNALNELDAKLKEKEKQN